jgi:hypothetical protein
MRQTQFHSRLAFCIAIMFFALLPACTLPPEPQPTPIPTLAPFITATPGVSSSTPTATSTRTSTQVFGDAPRVLLSSTPPPTPIQTPVPLQEFSRTLTPHPRETAWFYSSRSSTIQAPCNACYLSPDRRWGARNIEIKDKNQALQIFNEHGDVAWTFATGETDGFAYMYYYPTLFDSTSHWLFAEVQPTRTGDGGFGPHSYGLVRINLQTGQMISVLGRNYYYGFAYSPDRTQVGYTLEYAAGVLNLITGEQHLYALPYKFSLGIAWSPDGSRFATRALRDPEGSMFFSQDVVVISPARSQPVQVIQMDDDIGFSAINWSGQNKLIMDWFQLDLDNPTPVPFSIATPQ